MKIFITGAGGFAGRWLTQELEGAGHQVVGPVGHAALDVTDAGAVLAALSDAAPQAVAHLAAMAYAPDARTDPARAFQVAVGGTVNVMEAVRTLSPSPAVLVIGSSEVYGAPAPEALPLTEDSALAPRTPYALSKIGQEGAALAYGARYGMRLAVARSFNHSGPGQRPEFVVPAFAHRVLAVRHGAEKRLRVGNVDVRRDFTDVRDIVRAYRLLLEWLAGQPIGPGIQDVYNVASGRSVAIRWLLEELCRLAGVSADFVVDPDLVRSDDPPDIRGDASRLEALTGWRPERPLEQMLADVWTEVSATGAATGAAGTSAR